jgi:hypothetical protein
MGTDTSVAECIGDDALVDARGITGVKRAYGAKLCDYFRAAVCADAGG